jgi:hypothetical protein
MLSFHQDLMCHLKILDEHNFCMIAGFLGTAKASLAGMPV